MQRTITSLVYSKNLKSIMKGSILHISPVSTPLFNYICYVSKYGVQLCSLLCILFDQVVDKLKTILLPERHINIDIYKKK